VRFFATIALSYHILHTIQEVAKAAGTSQRPRAVLKLRHAYKKLAVKDGGTVFEPQAFTLLLRRRLAFTESMLRFRFGTVCALIAPASRGRLRGGAVFWCE
jgi:hypothetical protein